MEKEVRKEKRREINENIGTKKCFRCMEIVFKVDFVRVTRRKMN